MQNRIEHLEGLVQKLIKERHDSPLASSKLHAAPEPHSRFETPNGAILDAPDVLIGSSTLIDDSRSVFLGDNWREVLQEIQTLKEICSRSSEDDDHDLQTTPSPMADGSSLLFNQTKPLERMELLASLPAKSETDRLIKHFFDRKSFPITIPPILHEETFRQEYERHWREPSQTSIIWIGLLFAVLGVAMLAEYQYGGTAEYEGRSESLFQLYRMRTAQCLLSGDIAKCLPYTVETLRLNATAELNRKDDHRRGLWMMAGLIVRAAINMGYHRDPSHVDGISDLQAEYRRRVWLSVVSMDDMSSFLAGFPRMASPAYSDTKEPRNIYDWELSDNKKPLSISRPLEEATPVTYMISKGRLYSALGRVADLNNTPHLVSYDIVLEVDKLIVEAYQNFPSHLKLEIDLARSTSFQTMARFSTLGLFSAYHRGLCVLHRRFIARANTDNHFSLSRHRCVSSSLAILSFQRFLELAFYQFSQIRQLLSLAATLLLLELELRRLSPQKKLTPDTADILRAVEDSLKLWESAKEVSREVSSVYAALMSKLTDFRAASQDVLGPDQGLLLLAPTAIHAFPLRNEPETYDLTEINAMNMDWASWDAFIEESSFGTGPVY